MSINNTPVFVSAVTYQHVKAPLLESNHIPAKQNESPPLLTDILLVN